MLPTIHLDDQSMFHTNKIDDVRTQRFLAFKFVAAQAMGSQVIPETSFGLGGCRTLAFGAIEERIALSPGPSPASGRGEWSCYFHRPSHHGLLGGAGGRVILLRMALMSPPVSVASCCASCS